MDKSTQVTYDTNFLQKVEEASGANINRCYQCLTCSLGCPVVFAMDYMPNQIVRMVQLGLKQQTLTSSAIWICASCETCATRCPNEVEILRLMDALREMALRERMEKEKSVTALHHIFLENIKRWGKQHELSMVLQLKLKTGDFFSDIDLGIKMLLKGKLKPLPSRGRDLKGVKAIFQKIDRLTRGEQP